jgi:hypothetical protein
MGSVQLDAQILIFISECTTPYRRASQKVSAECPYILLVAIGANAECSRNLRIISVTYLTFTIQLSFTSGVNMAALNINDSNKFVMHRKRQSTSYPHLIQKNVFLLLIIKFAVWDSHSCDY